MPVPPPIPAVSKDHIRAADRRGDSLSGFVGGLLTDIRLGTGSLSVGNLLAYLNLLRRLRTNQRLPVGIH